MQVTALGLDGGPKYFILAAGKIRHKTAAVPVPFNLLEVTMSAMNTLFTVFEYGYYYPGFEKCGFVLLRRNRCS